MTHAPDLTQTLVTLLATTGQIRGAEEARVGALAEEIREAQTFEHRRAARSERDRACYRVGSAFEPLDALGIDDVALTGLLHLNAADTLMLLARVATEAPGRPLAVALQVLLAGDAGTAIRERGIWVRWRWLADLYRHETETFLTSKKARDPKQRWRGEPVTANQRHLIREISRLRQVEAPIFAIRGDAFEWIRDASGNPRFAADRPCPAVAVPAFGATA